MGGLNNKQAPGTHNAKIIGILIACICVCLAFVAGFLARGDEALLKRIGLHSLVAASEANPGATVTGNTYDSVSARVAEVEGILQSESLDTYSLDATTGNILLAFADSTEDPFLRYYDPSRYAAYIKESVGTYAGIGVLFAEYEGKAFATDVFAASAAEAAGIQQGDFLVAIDGDRSQDWTSIEAVTALSRSEGDTVVVTWRRPAAFGSDGGEEFTTTLVCSDYSVPNVEAEMRGQVGFITLKQFTQNSASLVKAALEDLAGQGATSYVVDIRNNPGGYLTQAVDTASYFVKSGVIVGIQTKKEHDTSKQATGGIVTDRPVVVLVNGQTAGAAEVFAAALKDNKRATLLGTTTMGKGSVQVVRPLSFGGALRYTAAYYKSPLGHEINGVGVMPNVTVSAGDVGDDTQKSLAVETAQSLVAA